MATENTVNRNRRDCLLRYAAECTRTADKWQASDRARYASYGEMYRAAAKLARDGAALYDADDRDGGKVAHSGLMEMRDAHHSLPDL